MAAMRAPSVKRGKNVEAPAPVDPALVMADIATLFDFVVCKAVRSNESMNDTKDCDEAVYELALHGESLMSAAWCVVRVESPSHPHPPHTPRLPIARPATPLPSKRGSTAAHQLGVTCDPVTHACALSHRRGGRAGQHHRSERAAQAGDRRHALLAGPGLRQDPPVGPGLQSTSGWRPW